MSKKSFILTALLINLTICLTICIVLYTDKDKRGINNFPSRVSDDSEMQTLNTQPVQTIEYGETYYTDNSSQEMSGDNINDINEDNSRGETTKVIESQVSSETPPVTYKNNETTTLPVTIGEQTTTSMQNTVTINGTTATIKSSCNIRSVADVGGNVLGTAGAGNSYAIDTSKCTKDWIAIIMESGQIGYVAMSYCDIH